MTREEVEAVARAVTCDPSHRLFKQAHEEAARLGFPPFDVTAMEVIVHRLAWNAIERGDDVREEGP